MRPAIYLGRRLPGGSSNLPAAVACLAAGTGAGRTRRSLFGFTTREVCQACPLLGSRWALTPPFRPYRRTLQRGGGMFSVALSVAWKLWPPGPLPLASTLPYVARTFLSPFPASRAALAAGWHCFWQQR